MFINTPMKVGNPDWRELGIEPTDMSLRNKVGRSFDPADLSGLGDAVAEMIAHPNAWSEKVSAVRDEMIFNLGHAAEVAGEYLLERVLIKQDEENEEGGRDE